MENRASEISIHQQAGKCVNSKGKISILLTASLVISQSQGKRARDQAKLEIAQKIMLKYRHAYQISHIEEGESGSSTFS